MGNRVEDLETQVTELQAAVDGLTEELVETKERLSQLERAADAGTEPTSKGDAHAEFVANSSSEADGAVDDGESPAQTDARSDGDGANSEEPEGGDDGESSEETDDIIVA